jgi:transposase
MNPIENVWGIVKRRVAKKQRIANREQSIRRIIKVCFHDEEVNAIVEKLRKKHVCSNSRTSPDACQRAKY